MKLLKIWIFNLLLIGFTVYFSLNNDYLREKNRECVVLDKIHTNAAYRVSAKFYLVLKDEMGRVFDLSVSPATFSQAKEGEKIYFNLREMDIKQTRKDNIIYFTGEALLVSLTIASLIVSIIYLLVKK